MRPFPGAAVLFLNGARAVSDETSMDLKRSQPTRLACLLRNVALDDRGGEVLEYALIAGLIVVAAMVTIHAVGSKVVAKWTSLNSSM
jgi:Flp pilus assembly pilin Flp